MLNGQWGGGGGRLGHRPLAHLRHAQARRDLRRGVPLDRSGLLALRRSLQHDGNRQHDDRDGGGPRHDADWRCGDPGRRLAPARARPHHGSSHRTDGARRPAAVPDSHARGIPQRDRDAARDRGLDERRHPPPRDRRAARLRPAARALRRALAQGAVPGESEAEWRVPDGGVPPGRRRAGRQGEIATPSSSGR